MPLYYHSTIIIIVLPLYYDSTIIIIVIPLYYQSTIITIVIPTSVLSSVPSLHCSVTLLSSVYSCLGSVLVMLSKVQSSNCSGGVQVAGMEQELFLVLHISPVEQRLEEEGHTQPAGSAGRYLITHNCLICWNSFSFNYDYVNN